jgi:hypothetical protein
VRKLGGELGMMREEVIVVYSKTTLAIFKKKLKKAPELLVWDI